MQQFWLNSVILFSILINLSVCVPTTTLDSDHHVETTLNSVVPFEFPKFDQNYTFVDNSSIRENLVSHSENDTEVEDLLGEDEKTSLGSIYLTLPNLIPNPSEEDIIQKNDTEWIENGDDTEDNKFKVTLMQQDTNNSSSLSEEHPPLLFGGQIAAFLAGIFLVISILAYVGLLLWRRHLEHKYGSREMLVNEDDFIDPNDMKHFSI